MNLIETFRKFFSPAKTKTMGSPSFWHSYGSLGSTYDAFGGQGEPNKTQLVKAYDDVVYACVSMIAQNIAHVPIKLYVKTATGQRKPKHATKPVHWKQKAIQERNYGTLVEEVVEHPLLELLGKCNAYHNRQDLLELTELYLDLTGNSYWNIKFNGLGIPEELYMLPSHLVQPRRDANYFVEAWEFHQGSENKVYSLKEIIHFRYANPADPYGEGVSPLRGAWGRVQIASKELSYLDNYLSNMGKPDAVLSIKDSISPLEAERVNKEFHHRYQGQGNGGLLVLDGTMNLQPLNFPAKDLAELQLYQVLKTTICNCFHIPPDIFELGTSSNRSTKEAALYGFAADCLAPRLSALVQKLNDVLVPYFDDRLFFEADNVIPEDKVFDLQKMQTLLAQQVITRDEVRIREGFPSAEWAQAPLLPSGVMPTDAFDEEQQAEPEAEPVDRTAQAQAIQTLQASVYAGQLPLEAGLAQLRIIYGFSPEEASALLPQPAAPATPPAAPQNAPKPEEAQPAPEDPEQPQEQGKGLKKCGGEGGTPGPCPEGGAKPAAGDKPTSPHEEAKEAHISSWAEKIKSIPGKIFAKAKTKVTTTYTNLEARYGKPTAIAIIGAGIVGLPLPVPGSSFITAAPVIAAAELYKRFGKKKAEDDLQLSQEDIDKLGKAFIDEILNGWEDSIKDELGDDSQEQPQEQKAHVHNLSLEELAEGLDNGGEVVLHLAGQPVTLKSLSDTSAVIEDEEGLVEYDLADFQKNWKGQGFVCKAHLKSPKMASPMKLIKALDKFFGKLMKQVTTKFKAQKSITIKDWFDVGEWTKVMQDDMKPVLSSYYDYAAKETVSSLNLAGNLFNVVQPNLGKALDSTTFHFCNETLATTHKALDEAYSVLKKELEEGLTEGDGRNELMKRVQTVFSGAENDRAYRIGVTEASRAQHEAQVITAKASGVVKGKTWLLSSDACPLCLPLSGKSVGLDEEFESVGSGPYGTIKAPPRHPYCRCTLTFDIED